MKVCNLNIKKVDALSNFDDLNINKINQFWNKNSKYKDFDELKLLNKFNNFEAVNYIIDNNMKEQLVNLEINKTRSKLEDDVERITVEFKDDVEAKDYFLNIQKSFEPKSLFYNLKQNNNKIEFTYTRLTLDDKKVYRTKQQRITKDAANLDTTKLTSLNINSLNFLQQLHKKDKELLVNLKFDVASSNDTLNRNSKEIEDIKDNFLSLKNKTNKAIKKDNLNKRGSNKVNTNIKKDIEKDEIKQKVEKEVKTETKTETTNSFKTFAEIQKRVFEKKIEQLETNKDTILKTYDDFVKNGYTFDNIITKLEKSYKNEYIKDFIVNALDDRNLETLKLKDELKDTNQKLVNTKDELESANSNVDSLKAKLVKTVDETEKEINELGAKLEKVINVAEKLDNENNKLKENVDNLLEKNKAISLEKIEVDKAFYKLTEVSQKLENEKNTLQDTNSKLNKDLEDKNNTIINLQSENEKLNSANSSLQNENEVLLTNNNSLKDELENVKNDNSNLQSENEKLLKEIELLIQNNKDLEAKNIDLTNNLNKTFAENEKLNIENTQLEKANNSLQNVNEKLNEKFNLVNEKNEILEEAVDEAKKVISEVKKDFDNLKEQDHKKDIYISKLETKVEMFEKMNINSKKEESIIKDNFLEKEEYERYMSELEKNYEEKHKDDKNKKRQ